MRGTQKSTPITVPRREGMAQRVFDAAGRKRPDRLQQLKGLLGFKNKAQRDKAEIRKPRQKVLERQKYLELIEIVPQTWSFVFGDDLPEFMKEICEITNITPRNLWMEPLFLYNQIKALRPDEMLHSAETYALKWQPPGSPYRMSIPLVDIALQETIIYQINRLTSATKKGSQPQILFYFSPRDTSISLFAIKVHPATLVSYRTKIVVLEQLCSYYLDRKFPLSDLHKMLSCDYDTWKSSLYNFLPADFQAYHRYLLDKPPPILTFKKMEERYHKDECSLENYSDFKFPDRREKRDKEALVYPRPYKTEDCVICHQQDGGTIHCPVCTHMVCKECIRRYFLKEETKIGSFLYMHRLFCLKKNIVEKISINICTEPVYLTAMRENGRDMTVDAYEREASRRQQEEEAEDEGLIRDVSEYESEHEVVITPLKSEKMSHILPYDLEKLKNNFEKIYKKYLKLKKKILDFQISIETRGHTLQFLERLKRLKEECMVELNENVQNKLDILDWKYTKIDVSTDFFEDITYEKNKIQNLIRDVNFLFDMRSVYEYEQLLKNTNTIDIDDDLFD
mmetsp:Transcript_30094/g.28757  ORF Transcript_30094/g.28757 Transcript_30094/m.28757 type:complete len:566 (-) Transcript_30094:283-1980(-)